MDITGQGLDYILTLSTTQVAPFVWIETSVPDVSLSDNGFIIKTSPHNVYVTSETLTELKASDFKVMSLMDIYEINE